MLSACSHDAPISSMCVAFNSPHALFGSDFAVKGMLV